MSRSTPPAVSLRREATVRDAQIIRDITAATGFFRPEEVDVAVELLSERVDRGEQSGYHFAFAESEGRTAGYVCFGPIACTVSSHDLYWIAVHPDFQGRGIGSLLIREAERLISTMGGRRVYVETSSRAEYAATRRFYESRGYRPEAVLQDFYAPGDGKVVYVRLLP